MVCEFEKLVSAKVGRQTSVEGRSAYEGGNFAAPWSEVDVLGRNKRALLEVEEIWQMAVERTTSLSRASQVSSRFHHL